MSPLRDTVTRAVVRTKAIFGIERPIFARPAVVPEGGDKPTKDPHPKGLFTVPELSGRVSAVEQRLYGVEAISNQQVADALVLAVEYALGSAVEGDICEFGSMTGRTGRVLAAAMAAFGQPGSPRTIHLFDSFEGLPASTNEIDRRSAHVTSGVWGAGTCKGITPQELRVRCEEYLSPPRVKIYEGWFAKTVSEIPSGTRFSVLHVDCDLYQSTLDCLDPLFAKAMVAPGAALLFDDWNCNRASSDRGERLAWAELSKKYAISHSDWGSYGWAGHRFIVHGYAGAPG
ncbi:MAG: TylF/MycF/NovP-related O-methyltransferase [Planctomycetota bacterium]